MRPCKFEDFENLKVKNLEHIKHEWFNRLCPDNPSDDTFYKVMNN